MISPIGQPECASLLRYSEVVDMVTMLATVALAVAAIYALRSLYFHKRMLDASVFGEASRRISALLAEEPYVTDAEALENWYIRLYGAFEYLAFFANHGYLGSEMKDYYRPFIGRYNERIQRESAGAIEHFKHVSTPDLFKELRQYVGELPF